MSIQELKTEIKRLPPKKVASLAKWLGDYDAQLWDEEIADDLDAGKLNEMLEEVDKEWRERK